jgi:coiled-coil domain-containing protein 63/114
MTKVQNCEITENYYNESIYGGQRTIKKLENRLDVVNKRAGSVMTENTSLRSVIDHMLLERATFNTMWEKLVQRLHERKKYMLDLIEQSTTAYDQREELCKKLQVLKDKTNNEKMMHVQEMRDLQRMLDHDANLLEFLGIKGHKRSSADMDAREADKQKKEQEEYERQIEEYELILTRILVSIDAVRSITSTKLMIMKTAVFHK